MEQSKLIFSLDQCSEGPTVVFSKDKHRGRRGLGLDLSLDLGQGECSQACHMPHCPSSPGFLADLCAPASASLVKLPSSSTEPSEVSPLPVKFLLSSVKSPSTDIARRGEPDVSLSELDSKLHVHPWKQSTQAEAKISGDKPDAGGANEDRDAWACSSSPGGLSPSEHRGSSLIADLEDTRRRFSEAMQDPLSMLSKIMGDESSISPRQGKGLMVEDLLPLPSSSSLGSSGVREGSVVLGNGEDDTQLRCRRRVEGELRVVCDTPQIRPGKPHNNSLSHYGDTVQAEDFQATPQGRLHTEAGAIASRTSLPLHWLFAVGFLAYGFFVLPLPSCVTGLFVGLACGFMLGLLVVFMFAPRRATAGSSRRYRLYEHSRTSMDAFNREADHLEGWMNEMHSYDPETFQPSLTHSVYATLEGSRLRLAYPSTNVPRRGTFAETPHEATFVRARSYQLANCKVYLLPAILARKRLWNNKYPICIILAEGELGDDSLVEALEEEEDTKERQSIPEPQLPVTLYLFGRTGREKEEWFQRFLFASESGAINSSSREESGTMNSSSREESNTEGLCCGNNVKESNEELRDIPTALKTKMLLEYNSYMTHLIGLRSGSPIPSPCHSNKGSPTICKKCPDDDCGPGDRARAEPSSGGADGGHSTEGHPAWVNSLVGRIFWDFLREKYWSDQVAHKIQKKLSRIRLPYFMNELTLADLDMGTCLPQVVSTSKPFLDRRGLWLKLDVMYTGGLQMTLETKMNLCKLGKDTGTEPYSLPETLQVGSKPRLCILADSDEESSSAGSSDEEDVPPTEPPGYVGEKNTTVGADGHTGGSTSKRLLRFVDKIAKSKYFQKATENEYIRKKIAEVSNMPLMLTVEVLELSGTLAVNIPPPPTDRIWYSFIGPPRLDLRVRPMLGEREVTFTHITEWIERKLQCEFQKVFVMPNMDDLYLPLMTSGLHNPPPSQHSPANNSSRQSSVESQEYLSE